jgi:predicted metal-dependent hydrolase
VPQHRIVMLEVAEQTVSVKLIRHHWSRRMTLTVNAAGEIRLSVPPRTPWLLAEEFLRRSHGWIASNIPAEPTLRQGPTAAQKRQARQLIAAKLARWQPEFAKQPARVRIANQSSRWGSASTRGTLSFNWRLIELPETLVDYVVVHELAHLVEANHGTHFWGIVEDALPDYRELRRRLKAFALHD